MGEFCCCNLCLDVYSRCREVFHQTFAFVHYSLDSKEVPVFPLQRTAEEWRPAVDVFRGNGEDRRTKHRRHRCYANQNVSANQMVSINLGSIMTDRNGLPLDDCYKAFLFSGRHWKLIGMETSPHLIEKRRLQLLNIQISSYYKKICRFFVPHPPTDQTAYRSNLKFWLQCVFRKRFVLSEAIFYIRPRG